MNKFYEIFQRADLEPYNIHSLNERFKPQWHSGQDSNIKYDIWDSWNEQCILDEQDVFNSEKEAQEFCKFLVDSIKCSLSRNN